MYQLLLGVTLFLAYLLAYAQASENGNPASQVSDTDIVIWVVLGIVVFCAITGFYTWNLVKSERKRQLQNKQPE